MIITMTLLPVPPESPRLLIAAISGRAIAASARRAGYRPVVLDCFADRDTRAAAERWRAVAAPQSLQFNRRALLEAAAALAPGSPLIYGAGFEGRVPLLTRLAEGRELCGNPAAVLRGVKDAPKFFAQLAALAIPHPEVCHRRPPDSTGWLLKRSGGAGGTHIRSAAGPQGARDYFQRLHAGRPMSAVFLANGRRALVLGFNQQWTSPARPGLPYLVGGAVGRAPIPERVAERIRDRLDALVSATGLVGLNGLDFLLEGEHWSVLEVNPRPTATMELYDPDYDHGLVDQHLRACRGALPDAAREGPARGYGIVYAAAVWQVEPAFTFPSWCRDLPNPGATLQPGDPICTVHAEAESPDIVGGLVRHRERELRGLIGA